MLDFEEEGGRLVATKLVTRHAVDELGDAAASRLSFPRPGHYHPSPDVHARAVAAVPLATRDPAVGPTHAP